LDDRDRANVDISFSYYNFDQETFGFGERGFSAYNSAAPSNNVSDAGYFHVNLNCIPIETPANVISVEDAEPVDFFMKAAMNFTLHSNGLSECNAENCVDHGIGDSRPTFSRCVSSE